MGGVWWGVCGGVCVVCVGVCAKLLLMFRVLATFRCIPPNKIP